MASDVGTFGISTGTGTKTINIGTSGSTWATIRIRGTNLQPMIGIYRNGFQYVYPDQTTAVPPSKFIQLKNTSGTVVLEGTFTSFTGTNMVLGITTNTLGTNQTCLVEFGS